MISFKTPQIEKEFEELKNKNVRLRRLLVCANEFCELEFNKSLVLTQIFRTPEEQKALYAQTANPPAASPHMIWRGADIRSTVFTAREIERLLAFLNTFSYQGGQRKVSIYHAIAGQALHFHVQYS
jgi:hypothetical protein